MIPPHRPRPLEAWIDDAEAVDQRKPVPAGPNEFWLGFWVGSVLTFLTGLLALLIVLIGGAP